MPSRALQEELPYLDTTRTRQLFWQRDLRLSSLGWYLLTKLALTAFKQLLLPSRRLCPVPGHVDVRGMFLLGVL